MHKVAVFLLFVVSISSMYGQHVHQTSRQQVQKLLKETRQEYLGMKKSYEQTWSTSDDTLQMVDTIYFNAFANIVHTFPTHLTKPEKLRNLLGDQRYADRKAVVISMIEEDRIHPSQIEMSWDKSALHESVDFEDVPFAHYLLLNGAYIDPRIQEVAIQKSDEFLAYWNTIPKRRK